MSTKTKHVVEIILDGSVDERSKAIDKLAEQISSVHGQRKTLINQYFLSSMHHMNKGGHVSTIQKHIDFLLDNNYKEYDVFAIALRHLTPISFTERKREDKSNKKWITIIHKNDLPQSEINRRFPLILDGVDQGEIIKGFKEIDSKSYKDMVDFSKHKWANDFHNFIVKGTCKVADVEDKESIENFEGDIYKLEKFVKKVAKDKKDLSKGEKKETPTSTQFSRIEKSLKTQKDNIDTLMNKLDNIGYITTLSKGEFELIATSSQKLLDLAREVTERITPTIKRIEESYDDLIRSIIKAEGERELEKAQEKIRLSETGNFSELLKKAS